MSAAAVPVVEATAATVVEKYVCTDGDDCPCHTAEKSRPPPKPVATASLKVSIAAGDKLWLCSCGQSKKFPYCDGSHKAYNATHGTSFTPFVVEATEAKDLWLCQCGHSKNRPFCDGSHKRVHVAGAPAVAAAATATVSA